MVFSVARLKKCIYLNVTRINKSNHNFYCYRFCTPAEQCPIIDDQWESAEGVPISAILLGGRRPAGVPLVVESRDWQHGVFMGATMRSEATAAAEHAVSISYNILCAEITSINGFTSTSASRKEGIIVSEHSDMLWK